jgi:hypothetical protein
MNAVSKRTDALLGYSETAMTFEDKVTMGIVAVTVVVIGALVAFCLAFGLA